MYQYHLLPLYLYYHLLNHLILPILYIKSLCWEVSGVEEKLEELEETVDAMRKELIRLRWKAEALETAVAVMAGLAGAFLVTAVRLLLR